MNTKTVPFLLIALLIAASGCSSSGKTTPGAAEQNGGTKTETAANGPANSKKLDLEFFVTAGIASLPSKEQDFVKKTIDEKFNVNLKMTYMNSGPDATNKLNVRLSSNDVPDLIVTSSLDGGRYATDGLLADISKLVTPQRMPNYFKWISEAEVTHFQTEGFEGVRAPLPFARTNYWAWYVRKDWLDNLNMKVPASYEEFVEVSRAFTFKDPDGNGKNDTYGFSTAGNGTTVPNSFPQYVKNGIYGPLWNDGKHLYDGGTHENIGNVMADIKSMIDEKIVDPDWFLNKGNAPFDRLVQGKVGIVQSSSSQIFLESVPGSYLNKGRQINPQFEMVPFNPFPDAPGIAVRPVALASWAIPKAALMKEPEKADRIIDILDYLASPEGYLLSNYGLKDVHYTQDGNKITLNNTALAKLINEQGNFLSIYGFFTPDNEEAGQIGLEIINPDMSERDRNLLKTIGAYKKLSYTEGVNVSPPPGLSIAELRKQMNIYHTKMVFGELPTSKWPEYRNDLMTTYHGKEIFDNYDKILRRAGVLQ